MNSLGGYIATACVTLICAYLSQFLRPKIKIRYWLPHNFTFSIPVNPTNSAPGSVQVVSPQGNAIAVPGAPNTYLLLTQALTIQNFGRDSAEWVEIAHRRKPDFFQLHPALNYTESISPSGEHILRVESLAAREFFTVQFLGFTHPPELIFVRSPAGHASQMAWMTVRKYPRAVYIIMQLMMIIGVGFCSYWLIRAGHFLYKLLGF
jgi:hypothetical protein